MTDYRDIKFSTLVDKLNKGIPAMLAARSCPVPENEYSETVAGAGNCLLRAWGYPLQLDCGYYGEFYIRTAGRSHTAPAGAAGSYIPGGEAGDGNEPGILVAELADRYKLSKGPVGKREKQFRRFVKSGPRFEDKVSELISRRESGVSFRADESAWEIRKLGYSSTEEFVETYNAAKKLIDDAFGVWHRYATLSDEEKASIR